MSVRGKDRQIDKIEFNVGDIARSKAFYGDLPTSRQQKSTRRCFFCRCCQRYEVFTLARAACSFL
jgi:hypothetical protein